MAEVIAELPGPKKNGGLSQWDRFADGQVWKLTLGVDVSCTTASGARARAVNHAKGIGMKAIVRKLSDTEIAVQFTKRDESCQH